MGKGKRGEIKNRDVILSVAKNLMQSYSVYTLANWNNKVLYVGITNNLERRLFEHKHHLISGFTQKYNVSKLVYFETFLNVADALRAEKQIKGWVRVKKGCVN